MRSTNSWFDEGTSTFAAAARQCISVVAAGIFTVAITSTSSALAGAGDLDPDFGVGGKVTTDLTGASGHDEAVAMAVQRDGKIVVAGSVFNPATGNTDFALARYNENGRLDGGFGRGGKVTTSFPLGSDDHAFAVALQDDQIVVAGSVFNPATGNTDFALARYNENGRLDGGFGRGGKVTTSFPLGSFAEAEAVAVQRNGKIVVAGTAGVRVDSVTATVIGGDFALARYSKNGRLDASFGRGGKVTTDFAGESDEGAAVALQDGKIVVAGFTIDPVTEEDFALARYSKNGSLDASFGSGGKVTTDFFGDLDEGAAVALQRNGKIVVAGITVDPAIINPVTGSSITEEEFALARYNKNGSLDASFGSGGKVTTDFFGGFDLAKAIALQRNGKIVVAGVTGVTFTPILDAEDFALARYNKNGSLDASFGSGGLVATDFAGGLEHAFAVAVEDDKIIAVGTRSNSSLADVAGADFALAVYKRR